MRSIKPSRGLSALSAVGGVGAIFFGLFWIKFASGVASHGPDAGFGAIFPMVGVIFVIIAFCGVVYNLYNAFSGNRFSLYDITSSREESDTLTRLFSKTDQPLPASLRPNAPTPASRLQQLKDLRLKGLISEEEYEEQRLRIIQSV